jgi:flavodoxin
MARIKRRRKGEKMKKLVAYFSASGVTKAVAEALADAAQADLYEIKPVTPYTNADLNWRNDKSRSSMEMKDPSSRPAIAGKVDNMDEYGVVFIGFPIWWYVAPTIINTFLENHDFGGKTIIPFATSGSSGLGKTVEMLKPLCGGSVTWLPGRILNGKPSKEKLREWVSGFYLE